ncbi:hypothetical protein ACWGHM_36995 [Streptomyces sp. NPDC054904]
MRQRQQGPMMPLNAYAPGSHMHTRTTAGLATAALLALSACTTTDDPKAAPPPPRAAPSVTASPSAPLSPTRNAFGQSITTSDPQGTTTATAVVLGYEQGVKAQQSADEENGTTGYTWSALEIKVCSTKGNILTSRFPWILAYADGTRIEPSGTTYGDFPKPEYPFEAKVNEGDCVRGKTVYAVPASQRPERVLYTAQILPRPAEWAVPAQ